MVCILCSGLVLGLHFIVQGKQWHTPRKAFRPTSGLTSYEEREKRRKAMAVVKAKEKEMKEEKEAERQVRYLYSPFS
jgi:hypothetical protein